MWSVLCQCAPARPRARGKRLALHGRFAFSFTLRKKSVSGVRSDRAGRAPQSEKNKGQKSEVPVSPCGASSVTVSCGVRVRYRVGYSIILVRCARPRARSVVTFRNFLEHTLKHVTVQVRLKNSPAAQCCGQRGASTAHDRAAWPCKRLWQLRTSTRPRYRHTQAQHEAARGGTRRRPSAADTARCNGAHQRTCMWL